jgi:hypothetical protein
MAAYSSELLASTYKIIPRHNTEGQNMNKQSRRQKIWISLSEDTYDPITARGFVNLIYWF